MTVRLPPSTSPLATGASIPALVAAAMFVCLLGAGGAARAANIFASTFTPIKAPECVTDPSTAFFVENVPPVIPQHPSLPSEHFYLVVRYMGDNAISAAPSFDFSRFPDDYGWPPGRGKALTGLAVPDPKSAWQRASRPFADLDNSSAFQLHCYDAGSFINSWTFPSQPLVGGGAHSIYGFSFNNPPPPAVFDANPGTDFVLQAGIEIPWFANWPGHSIGAHIDPVGQVSLFAYFRDRSSGKLFALLLAIYDNREGLVGGYTPFIAHDSATPFASTPLGSSVSYASRLPYSSNYTGVMWTGLRFFRGHVSHVQFCNPIDDVNAYCEANRAARFCDADPRTGTAFSLDPLNYEITDFGVLHEIFRGEPEGNLSMGIHVLELGAWNAR